jgi:uncharacterized protein
MEFEWDPDKARTNLARHGVAFEDAVLIWDDPLYGTYFDRVESGEVRWWAVGVVWPNILIAVHMHPDPDDDHRVRIISARLATPKEGRRYEEDAAL